MPPPYTRILAHANRLGVEKMPSVLTGVDSCVNYQSKYADRAPSVSTAKATITPRYPTNSVQPMSVSASVLQPNDEVGVGRLPDDLAELGTITRHEAHSADRDAVHRPALAILNHPILERRLFSAPTSHHGRDGRPVAVDGLTGVLDRQRSEEHTSELQSRLHLVCRLLLEKKKLVCHVTLDRTTSRRSEPYQGTLAQL